MSRKFRVTILVLFALSCLIGCGGGGPHNNTGGDGSDEPGGASLAIDFWGTPPSSYNPNSQSRFEVSFEPTIQGYTSGRHKIWFKLLKGDSVYAVSNCVDFSYYDTGVKTVEFGGALPDIETSGEKFEMRGVIQHYEDTIVTNWAKTGLYNITIHKMNLPTKIMNIEYDYQDSDTSAVDSYDIFSVGENVERQMKIAFYVANTGFDIWVSDENLDAKLVRIDYIGDYAYEHRVSLYTMYLCAVKGFCRDEGGPMIDESGGSIPAGEDGGGGCSLVGVKAIMTTNYYYQAVIPKVTIHELGFQRSDDIKPPEDHPEQHNSVFCVMYRGADLPDRNLYYNPHFCGHCVDALKDVNW